jgi:hypothetical protein
MILPATGLNHLKYCGEGEPLSFVTRHERAASLIISMAGTVTLAADDDFVSITALGRLNGNLEPTQR